MFAAVVVQPLENAEGDSHLLIGAAGASPPVGSISYQFVAVGRCAAIGALGTEGVVVVNHARTGAGSPPSSPPVPGVAGAGGLDAQQQARLDHAVREAQRLYPDSPELQRTAIGAATDYLLGSTTVATAGAELSRIRREDRRVRARVRQIATMALADGHSERGVAREVGVDRMILRRWLGKPKPFTASGEQGSS